jgi:hypothetical protein
VAARTSDDGHRKVNVGRPDKAVLPRTPGGPCCVVEPSFGRGRTVVSAVGDTCPPAADPAMAWSKSFGSGPGYNDSSILPPNSLAKRQVSGFSRHCQCVALKSPAEGTASHDDSALRVTRKLGGLKNFPKALLSGMVGSRRDYFLSVRFRNRTPTPPPFSSMNSTPAASKARRIA